MNCYITITDALRILLTDALRILLQSIALASIMQIPNLTVVDATDACSLSAAAHTQLTIPLLPIYKSI